MRLGISSYTYTWAVGVPGHLPERPMSLLDLLDKASALGVRVLQVADNLPLDRLSDAELETFESRAAELDIGIEVGTRGIAHQQLRTYLRLAERLRSPLVRIVIDTPDHHPHEDQVISALKDIMPEFERAGVCLAVENHDRFKARTLAEILERVGSEFVGICLDTVNSFGALEGPEAVLETLGPSVVNLHVKDFAICRADHMMGFSIEGRPAGQGRMNLPWLFQELRDQGRDPNAILELWTPPAETLAATIAKEDAWATASVEYLRTLIPN
jgi:sugar phosphate isomerase/epimerase